MDQDIILDVRNATATWKMPRLEGEYGGTYTGTFVFRCYLTPLQTLQAGRELRELLGNLGAQASDTEYNLSVALTQLKQRIVKAPVFWTATKEESGIEGNLGDMGVIKAVLDASIKAEELFLKKINEEREELLNKTIKAGEEILKKGEE